jgi:drug/metabolite transporter (DMT)-like permease
VDRVTGRPVPAALAGALTLAFSAILYRLADVSPSTGAFFRCLYALPLLFLLARLENGRFGPRPARARALAILAGLLFAADLILWHHAIEAVGAGLGTVLGNTQVLLVGLIAWALLGERPSGRLLAAIPIAMTGVVLISGVTGEGAYGDDPALGVVYGVLTGIAYSGFLLALRQGSGDRIAGPLFDATAASAAGVAVFGLAAGDLELTPGLESQGWLVLLATSSQVLAWLLITLSLPRLPAVVTSVLLTLQPVAAVGFAAVLVAERPSALQLVGALTILAGLVLASAPVRPSSREPRLRPAALGASRRPG